MSRARRSRSVSLLLLGTVAALQACSDEAIPLQRQRYASREDCDRDWNDPALCEPAPGSAGIAGGTGGGGYGGGGAGWLGPRYYWDHRAGAPVVIDPDGHSRTAFSSRVGAAGSDVGVGMHAGSISRGGFGSIGHGFAGLGG